MFENEGTVKRLIKRVWIHGWMMFAGKKGVGKVATRFATWLAPPHKAQIPLANMNRKGYFAPTAVFHHSDLELGKNAYVGDRVILYQARMGGSLSLGDRVYILRDCVLETGIGGCLSIGEGTWIHPRCQINAYKGSIKIGRKVQIAPNCAFYSYDHGFMPGEAINAQPLYTKGDINIGDEVWFGVGVIVLSGVTIGRGAVIGAGSLVTRDIPPECVAVGVPARVVKKRGEVGSVFRGRDGL